MKRTFPHLPPQKSINIHDAAILLQEWTGDTMIWGDLFPKEGVVQLHRGKASEKLPYYNLSRHGNVCEFKNRRNVFTPLPKADLNNAEVFRRLHFVSSNNRFPFNPLKSLCSTCYDDCRILIFNDGRCYLTSKKKGIEIVTSWSQQRESLYLYNVDESIPYGLMADKAPKTTTLGDTKIVTDLILQYRKDPSNILFF